MKMNKLSDRGQLGALALTTAAARCGHVDAASAETLRVAKLFYTDAGKGRNLMLLHGWVAVSHDWSWQLPILEKRYHTIAVDLRGHGRSEVMPAGQYQPNHYALDIISLIETEFPGQKFTLIGHSMGGQIAARIAALRPDLVDAVISVDGSLGFDERFTPLFQETSDRPVPWCGTGGGGRRKRGIFKDAQRALLSSLPPQGTGRSDARMVHQRQV